MQKTDVLAREIQPKLNLQAENLPSAQSITPLGGALPTSGPGEDGLYLVMFYFDAYGFSQAI